VETRVAALLELIDEALQVSEQRLLDESDAVMIERVSNVVRVLQKTRDETLSGSLVPSGGVATLGFTREVLDWGEALDSPLLKSVRTIDRYYRDHF